MPAEFINLIFIIISLFSFRQFGIKNQLKLIREILDFVL